MSVNRETHAVFFMSRIYWSPLMNVALPVRSDCPLKHRYEATYSSSPSLSYSFACVVPETTRNCCPSFENFTSCICDNPDRGH